ncbi:MAG: hypothetical protein WC511_06745 [Candidatus Pacearchaeota archaeon]|jgi:hypothetical protein
MKKEKGIDIPVNKDIESRMRLEKFAAELKQLQENYGIGIYAVNQVQQNGEVIPIVKLIDNKK